MPTLLAEQPTSRYGVQNDDLRQAALALQLGEGIADRLRTLETTRFLVLAEDWAESQIAEYIAVPLKPARAPGQKNKTVDPTKITRRNFPLDFIQAVIYRATGLLLHSEFFENAPNTSEAGTWALQLADKHISDFKDSRATLVGAGRLRHPNPHMPPNISPKIPTSEKITLRGNV
jgi:hypothetical protein